MKQGKCGMVQYFYHSPASKLPIRDVLNQHGMGNKHEPHIEAGAENLLDRCYQRNIASFAASSMEYLFLLTRCSNSHLRNHYDNQYIVGYIQKKETGKVDDRVYVRGDTKLYSFDDAVSVTDVFESSFNRVKLMIKPYVDAQKTEQILNLFSDKKIDMIFSSDLLM
jgi:hypothetical protein